MRAAEVMESQARNLRERAHRLWTALNIEVLSDLGEAIKIAIVEIDKIAEALEHAAGEEREAGKRWWKEQESQIRHRPRVDGEIQIPPDQEKWF